MTDKKCTGNIPFLERCTFEQNGKCTLPSRYECRINNKTRLILVKEQNK